MNIYLLVDRSGSMRSNWIETLGSLNAYLEALNTKSNKHKVTVAVFDDRSYDTLRDNVSLTSYKPLLATEASPRGMTPLYDSFAKLAGKILEDKPKKATVVVVTDGEENNSKEHNQKSTLALVDELKTKKYDIVFLGANFDNARQASSVGVARGSSLSMTPGNFMAASASLASRTMSYQTTGVATDFTEEDRARQKTTV